MQQQEDQGEHICVQSLCCPSHNKARFICISQGCQDSALMCFRENCQVCMQAHEKCRTYSLTTLFQGVMAKKQEISSSIRRAVEAMEKIYDDILEKISIEREELLQSVKYLGLNQLEIQLLKSLNAGKSNEIAGKDAYLLFSNIRRTDKWDATSRSVNDYWRIHIYRLNQMVKGLRTITRTKTLSIQSEITQQDSIIRTLFTGRHIQTFELLYRASQNDFSTEKFHQICDGKKNTIVLAKTEHGNIVGAYNPMSWSSTNNFQLPKGNKPFLFSVTHRKRYDAASTELRYAKFNSQEGPCFGKRKDFFIANSADKFPNSIFNFNSTYTKTTGKAPPKNVSGEDAVTQNVKLTEWEVFLVK